MKKMSMLALLLASSVAYAHGDATPKAEWKPQMELQKKLTDSGWKVRQVKTENNCYEVYGFDEKGARAEAFFDPRTFERVDPDPKQAKK